MSQNPQRPLAWTLLNERKHRVTQGVANVVDRLNTESIERLRRSTERAWWMEH